MAVIHRFSGARADSWIQGLAIIVDSMAALVVCWIASRLFGAKVGVLAGLAYALFPPLAYASVNKMPSCLLSFFVVSGLACAVVAAKSEYARSLRWYAACGVVVGLGSYLRPDYMLMPVALCVGSIGRWTQWRRYFMSVFVAQGMVFLVLLPWATRNHDVTERWIFTSTSVGVSLITGLGSFDNPWNLGYADEDRQKEAEEQGFVSFRTSEADLYFRRLFWRYVREDPDAYAASVVRRLPLALIPPFGWGYDNPWKVRTFTERRARKEDRYAVMRNDPFYFLAAYWDRLLISGLSFCCLVAVGVMVLVERNQLRLIALVLSPHVYSICGHLVTHLEPRYLLPSMSCWLIGLAYVLGQGWQRPAVNRLRCGSGT